MDAELDMRLQRIERLALLSAKNVLTVEDVALLLGRSPKTIRNMVSRSEIPCYLNGHTTYFKRSEIEAWQCQVKREFIPSTL